MTKGNCSAISPYYILTWWSHRRFTTAHACFVRQNALVYLGMSVPSVTMTKGPGPQPVPKKVEGKKQPNAKCVISFSARFLREPQTLQISLTY